MRMFYEPTAEHLTRLSRPWCASFSGGKDSTALVTWVEWLRRAGWLTYPAPKLVRSDTGVEDAALSALAEGLMVVLRESGWECATVRPKLHERLYNRILGIGNTPIHPGIAKMRWCTRSTKIDPMDRERSQYGDLLTLTGLRLGESAMRDGKIKRKACAAGGECGIPDPGERTYSPVLRWTTCQVVDWLAGGVAKEVSRRMADVLPLTRQLVDLYGFARAKDLFEETQVLSASRFGCIGCPAIGAERDAPASVVKKYGAESPLCELYDVWFEARRRTNRLWGARCRRQYGPIKMEVRKRLFERVMDIQRRAGVVLVTPEDEAFIRQCWAEKRYPRGWTEEDESVEPPNESPLFTKPE